MKRVVIMLLIASLLLAAGCKKTPEEMIILTKDTKDMLLSARSLTNRSKIRDLDKEPFQYIYECINNDDSLHINVNATVYIPSVGAFPIVAVQECGFDQATTSKIFRYLYPDKKPYSVPEYVETKADLEELLITYQKMLAEKEFDFLDESELLYLINWVQERYNEAPDHVDTPSPKKSNGRMEKISDGTTTYFQLSCQLPDIQQNIANNLYIRSYGKDGINSDLNKYEYLTGMSSTLEYYKAFYSNYSQGDEVPLDYMNVIPEKYQKDLLIDLNTAKEACDAFFQAIGHKDAFELGHISLIPNAENQYGLSFIFSRKIESCPSALITISSGYGTSDPYALPWGYEFIRIIVDDTGIIQINWDNPIAETEVLERDASILPFSSIVSTFERMINTIYAPQVDFNGTALFPAKLNISIESIRLELLRIREKGVTLRSGLVVPAWVFYGHIKRTEVINDETYTIFDPVGSVAFDHHAGPIIVMAINAIDGSVIDVSKGY